MFFRTVYLCLGNVTWFICVDNVLLGLFVCVMCVYNCFAHCLGNILSCLDNVVCTYLIDSLYRYCYLWFICLGNVIWFICLGNVMSSLFV